VSAYTSVLRSLSSCPQPFSGTIYSIMSRRNTRARTHEEHASKDAPLLQLPTELLEQVFEQLPAKELARCVPACKAFQSRSKVVALRRLQAPSLAPPSRLFWHLHCHEHPACQAWRCAFTQQNDYLGLFHVATGSAVYLYTGSNGWLNISVNGYGATEYSQGEASWHRVDELWERNLGHLGRLLEANDAKCRSLTDLMSANGREPSHSLTFGGWTLLLLVDEIQIKNSSKVISDQRPRFLQASGAAMLKGRLPDGGGGNYWGGFPTPKSEELGGGTDATAAVPIH